MDSVRKLRRAIAKGKIVPSPVNRLAVLRHRRGKRGHETAKGAKRP